MVLEERGPELGSLRVESFGRLFLEGSGIPQAAVVLWQRASCSSSLLEPGRCCGCDGESTGRKGKGSKGEASGGRTAGHIPVRLVQVAAGKGALGGARGGMCGGSEGPAT